LILPSWANGNGQGANPAAHPEPIGRLSEREDHREKNCKEREIHDQICYQVRSRYLITLIIFWFGDIEIQQQEHDLLRSQMKSDGGARMNDADDDNGGKR
jgi:hypothetical protein